RRRNGPSTIALHDALPISEQFGSYGAALAAWHSGEGRVSKNIKAGGDGIPNTRDIDTGLSTRDYVANILAGDEDLDSVFSTPTRSEEHTSELQSRENLVCR